MAIIRYNSIKPIEERSRRHFINSFNVSKVLVKTVRTEKNKEKKIKNTEFYLY